MPRDEKVSSNLSLLEGIWLKDFFCIELEDIIKY
mgnify:CR=1 FL=1